MCYYIVDGEDVYTWRDTLGAKYSDLPGVRRYRDFLVVKTHDGRVVMKVREKCCSRVWKESPLHILDITAPGVPDTKYSDHHYRAISKEKMANMVTMYDRFIPPNRRPDYLPALETSATAPRSSSSTSSTSEQEKSEQVLFTRV